MLQIDNDKKRRLACVENLSLASHRPFGKIEGSFRIVWLEETLSAFVSQNA
jgi:hypothetical protein